MRNIDITIARHLDVELLKHDTEKIVLMLLTIKNMTKMQFSTTFPNYVLRTVVTGLHDYQLWSLKVSTLSS